MQRTLAVASSLCSISFLSLSASSQTACLRGRVEDAAGAARANVRVTVTTVGNSNARELVTNAAGGFQTCDLVPGEYRVTAPGSGRSNIEQTVVVNSGPPSGRDDLTLRDSNPVAASSGSVAEFRYSAAAELPDTPVVATSSARGPHGEVSAMWGSGLVGQRGLTFQEQFPPAQFSASAGGDLPLGRTSYFVHVESFGPDSQTLLSALSAAQARAARPPSNFTPTLIGVSSIDARIDSHLGARDVLSTRFSRDHAATSVVLPAQGNLPQRLAQGRNISQTTVSAANSVALSARTLNESRAQFISTDARLPAGSPQVGINSELPTTRRDRVFEAANNVYRQVGGQSLKFGGDFLYHQMNLTFLETAAQSILGQSSRDTGLYVISEHRVLPNLLLSSGVRYELAPLDGFKTDHSNLAPQAGFAWSPQSGTVIRGGGSIYYNQTPLPAIASSGDSAAAANLQNSVALSGPLPSSTLFEALSPALQRSYVEATNFGVEQRVTAHTNISADYQFARGLQLVAPTFHSTALCGSDAACQAGRTFGGAEEDSGAASTYNGATIAFTQEPVRWGNYKVSYTYASTTGSGLTGDSFDLSDTLRRVALNSVLHTSSEPASDAWQRFVRGVVLSTAAGFSSRSEFTGINFLDVDARLSKTLFWGQHYRVDAVAETLNSFERTSSAYLKSVAGMDDRFINVYSTFRGVASLQGPSSAKFGLRLGF